MPTYHFETSSPVDLAVEINKGMVTVQCRETTESTVVVEGRHAEDVAVEQHGNTITVIEPGRGRIFGDNSLHVDVVVPETSNCSVRTGSADIRVEGLAGHGQLRSGSGDVSLEAVQGHLVVETGSGDIRVDDAQADVKVKSGSGDIEVGQAGGSLAVSTGSGDVDVESARGATVVKTGSGDLHVGEAHGDTSYTTGSGDLVLDLVHRGRILAKGASGDVVIGIPAGVPVWTDITTVSGRIQSDLQGAGEPQEGQEHVELRAKTVSGDVVLTER